MRDVVVPPVGAASLLCIVEPSADIPDSSVAAIQAWRAEHASGHAGAFNVSIGKAVGLSLETVGDAAETIIETAYPVRAENGDYTSIRVVTS